VRTIEIDFLSGFAAFFRFGLKSAARPIAAELETLGFGRVGIKRETVSDGRVVLGLVLAGVEHRTWAFPEPSGPEAVSKLAGWASTGSARAEISHKFNISTAHPEPFDGAQDMLVEG
jgi:hypothetical protein